ncbi:MAG: hypothetical protein WD623_07880 [Marinobacter sp.]|uniref:hypothetical protein n=1 Tax=Marinobacter sp. TaxID=50741 RepID=UPI0034A038FF
MKVLKRSALAAAVAFGSAAPAAYAEVDIYENEDLKVYLHTAIEVEKMFFRDDPADDGESIDQFDNELEFGVGAEFDDYWTAYFEMEIDNLRDNTNSRVRDGERGDLEITSAYIDYGDANNAGLQGRVGVFRDDLAGGTRLWFREHLVGARGRYNVSDDLQLEIGTGTLEEEGDDFGQDRQISWVSAAGKNLYSFVGVIQDDAPSGTPSSDLGFDPGIDDEFGDLGNVAIGWSGKLGNIGVHAEYNQNFGNAADGKDFKGRAAYAEFDTKMGAHKPRLLFAWGSGDDDPNDNDVEEFMEARGDFEPTKLFITEGAIENTTTGGTGGIEDADEGIGNITIAQIGNTFQVNPVWRADLSASYVALSEENEDGDKYLGTELNWINRWEHDTSVGRVRLYVDLGYIFSADAFGPDDLWIIEPGIRVEF